MTYTFAALASLSLVACGGSSGGTRTGAAGNNGGAAGSAGSAGGGAAGTGGTTSTTTLSCATVDAYTDPVVTDFTSTYLSANGNWGKTGGLTGYFYDYNGSKMADGGATDSVTDTLDRTNMDLAVTGNVVAGDYGGFGLAFAACVNTTMFKGVQFTLTGDAGGCQVILQVQTSDQQPTTNKGSCDNSIANNCYNFPSLTVTPGSDPIMVHWTDLPPDPTGAAIPGQLVGLQWQFESMAPTVDGGAQLGCDINVQLTGPVEFLTQ